MRRASVMLVVMVVAAATAVGGWAALFADETPFPSPKIANVFVSTRTVTAPTSPLGADVLTNYYPRGSTVVFKVFAGAIKSGKILTADDVRYAYVKLPDGTSVRLTYGEPTRTTDPAWTGSWTVPATYPTGLVSFVVRFKTKDKQYGNFVQLPVATSQLTVTKG